MKVSYRPISTPEDASFAIKEYCQPQFTSTFHFHHSYELILIVKSSGQVYVGNKVMNYKEGDVFMFGPGLVHCFSSDILTTTDEEVAHAIVVQFSADFMGKDFFETLELRAVKELLQQSIYGIKFDTSAASTSTRFFQFQPNQQMKNLILLLQILEELSLSSKQGALLITDDSRKIRHNESNAKKLASIFNYVFENYHREIDIQSAASIACMSKAAFCRYFKNSTHKTFSQFVNEIRVSHATKLLIGKDNNITAICYACGFDNVSYFNRQFKIRQGISPREYRKVFMESNADRPFLRHTD
ncbi:AraC family transcriptional regulator [Pedobacter sp. HDW13]|uniref:AraC family transcriptional regulator n=1 Tax=Pedobacter sp. HDW13 TaxID=2714940 RepID=UPI00140DA460|nr:AraC family transcriptional regulator [Pedobacter sp. HDW13]QIL40280.1 AraC family transcriptional regulator [Pedobacter sp. HDW13]